MLWEIWCFGRQWIFEKHGVSQKAWCFSKSMVFLKKHGVLPKIGGLNLYHVG